MPLWSRGSARGRAGVHRTIFHVDLDAFFVAVERTLNPDLIGRPVIVGGSVGSRGVVSSASYEARAFGVHSAMPIATARKLCPQAAYIPASHGRYSAVSREFMAILREHSPLVQAVSVDEAYVDMTGTERLFGPPRVAASRMRARIANEQRITASIGIGASKLVAKVASNECKPDGLLEVRPEDSVSFLAPLPIRRLPGLGPRAEEGLVRLGIKTLGDLATHPIGPLNRTLGPNAAQSLRRRAAGVDHSEVVPESEAKSISAETTFSEDTDDLAYLNSRLLELSEKVGQRLRRKRKQARVVVLKARYHDFETITRQMTLHQPGDGNEAIYRAATELLAKAMRSRRARMRLIGVGVGNLVEPTGQLSMLDDRETDDSHLSGTVDNIRARFGEDAIRRGSATRR